MSIKIVNGLVHTGNSGHLPLRLKSLESNAKILVSGALGLLHFLPKDVIANFWNDPLHGYFHGLYTVDIAVRLAGDRMKDPLFARALVLASLMHDITAFMGRKEHAKTGSEMAAGLCDNFYFWRPVQEEVRRAILTHEGKAPWGMPRTPIGALVHDADRLQEIVDVDRIVALSDYFERAFFKPDLPIGWRQQVLNDWALRDHKKNDNHMYFLGNLDHCFKRENFVTERAFREAQRIKPIIIERKVYWIERRLAGREKQLAIALLNEVLAGRLASN